ncbi:MAG: formyltetrahydrofolate deformylase [Cyclobacteriaceae bacterium]
MTDPSIVFLIQCPDQKGLIAKISSFFSELDYNILSCQQFTDEIQHQYFMRIKLDGQGVPLTRKELSQRFAELADKLDFTWSVHYQSDIANTAILVSKTSHCLFDLLERQSQGKIQTNIPLIISNHPDMEYLADQFRVPYYCLPIKDGNKVEQEQQILALLQRHHIDLVVLARYMQILTSDFISQYPGKIINIHHAFLPAFKGANPYRRAYERGVKMIGATAHYATNDLDEGPIIEQDVERVSHAYSPKTLASIGADIERTVLTRAVRSHLEHRVIITGNRTIIFPESGE